MSTDYPKPSHRKAESLRLLTSVAEVDKIEGVVTRVKWASLLGLLHCLGKSYFYESVVEELDSFLAVVLDNIHGLSESSLFIWKNMAKNWTGLGEI